MPIATDTRLYVASSNAGKLRDFRTAAALFQMPVEPLPGLASIPPPEEDGATFEENARIKAVAYSRAAPGLLVIADDSGLEVDALEGEPGVRSARYAEDAGLLAEAGAAGSEPRNTDQWNNRHLLNRLRQAATGVPWTARYRCVLAAARDGACLLTAAGTVEGEILAEPRGEGGFGYDPLFYLPRFQKTMAEIDDQTRQLLSHRGQALRALLKLLQAAQSSC